MGCVLWHSSPPFTGECWLYIQIFLCCMNGCILRLILVCSVRYLFMDFWHFIFVDITLHSILYPFLVYLCSILLRDRLWLLQWLFSCHFFGLIWSEIRILRMTTFDNDPPFKFWGEKNLKYLRSVPPFKCKNFGQLLNHIFFGC